jgi:hypothetical protein
VNLSRLIRAAASVLTGMLAAAMLLIRVVLVPFWEWLPPEAFREWFRKNSGRVGALMFPLGGAATLSATTAAITSRDVAPTDRRRLWLSAGCSIGVTAVTLFVNEPANKRFNGRELLLKDTPALLARWRRWHNVRTLLGFAAAFIMIRALSGTRIN